MVIRTAQKSLSEHFRHVLQLLIGLVTTMMQWLIRCLWVITGIHMRKLRHGLGNRGGNISGDGAKDCGT
ncbi:Uncharacterised protein [Citrobacter koseri]|uniref:Uncharacterized protein n=1 Tax=Citrobacter koseri TaxID=545 RepID=A0A3S4I7W7_CITKO|nr:Uncharacterised protein [Citrobacter koseri]